MGATISTFSEAIKTTVSRPSLVLVTAGVLLVGFFASFVLGLIPLVGQFIGQATYAVLAGGLIGVIGLGVTGVGTDSVSDFIDTVSDRGVTVFGVALIEGFIFFIFALILIVVTVFVGGLGAAVSDPATAQTADEAYSVFSGADLAFLFAMLVTFGTLAMVYIVLQFLTASVVLGNKDVGSSFKTSFRIVKENPVSVLGYTLLRFGFVFIVAFLLLTVISIAGVASEGLGILVGFLLALVVVPVVMTFYYAYHTHYYLEIESDSIDLPVSDDVSDGVSDEPAPETQ